MQAPTLVVLAAGLGSRFGGIKQMDPVGPCGEFVLDYSMYDAWRAGFKKVVLVIREELEAPLREHFGNKLDGKLEVAYVCQKMTDLPGGYTCPSTRIKPWGTGHAIWVARNAVSGPFSAINADDFYGAKSFQIIGDFLKSDECTADTNAMVAYRLANTLSENGTVSRGICTKDDNGYLTGVVERTNIEPCEGGCHFQDENGNWQPLTGDEPSSLNLWGFHNSMFQEIEAQLLEFLAANVNEPKKESFIPSIVDTAIKRKHSRCRVLETPEHWFGMTYSADHDFVKSQVADRIASGVYPENLWG